MISIALDLQSDGTCKPSVLLAIGHGANYRIIEIESIYLITRPLLGIPTGVHYIEMRGWDAATKEKMVIRFNSSADPCIT